MVSPCKVSKIDGTKDKIKSSMPYIIAILFLSMLMLLLFSGQINTWLTMIPMNSPEEAASFTRNAYTFLWVVFIVIIIAVFFIYLSFSGDKVRWSATKPHWKFGDGKK